MSFVFNDARTQQLSFFDSYNTLTDREKRFLDKSWAKYFAEHSQSGSPDHQGVHRTI